MSQAPTEPAMSQRAGKVPWPGTGNKLRKPTRSKGASKEPREPAMSWESAR